MKYTECIDSVVLESLHNTLMCSLQYFMNETEISRSNLEPLFEAQLELHFWKEEENAEIIFKPSMFANTGLCAIVNELMQNIFAQGSLISRVATHLKKVKLPSI